MKRRQLEDDDQMAATNMLDSEKVDGFVYGVP
jgi:hypothetical protein